MTHVAMSGLGLPNVRDIWTNKTLAVAIGKSLCHTHQLFFAVLLAQRAMRRHSGLLTSIPDRQHQLRCSRLKQYCFGNGLRKHPACTCQSLRPCCLLWQYKPTTAGVAHVRAMAGCAIYRFHFGGELCKKDCQAQQRGSKHRTACNLQHILCLGKRFTVPSFNLSVAAISPLCRFHS